MVGAVARIFAKKQGGLAVGIDDEPREVRRGAIGGVQGRNYIFPDRDITVIVFTNRSEAEFPFGELWQFDCFAYDLLSAAACPEPVS